MARRWVGLNSLTPSIGQFGSAGNRPRYSPDAVRPGGGGHCRRPRGIIVIMDGAGRGDRWSPQQGRAEAVRQSAGQCCTSATTLSVVGSSPPSPAPNSTALSGYLV